MYMPTYALTLNGVIELSAKCLKIDDLLYVVFIAIFQPAECAECNCALQRQRCNNTFNS